MAKFSVDGEDDGEGPSSMSPRSKRQRLLFPYRFARQSQPQPQPQPQPQSQPTLAQGNNDYEDDDDDDEPLSEENHDDAEEEEEELDAESDSPAESEDIRYVQRVARSSPASESTAVNAIGSSQGARDSAGTSRDGSVTVTLVDPDVLDCSICFNPLCAPVYQCENGHIACSACCTKIRNKCPSCSWPIGYNRCRAIEKVLESIKISCLNSKYGCNETLNYSKRSEHERICLHAPCSCPYEDCTFLGSSKQLSAHFISKHKVAASEFQYNSRFIISIKITDKFLILEEECEGTLFIVTNVVKTLGNIVTVSCIGPSSSKERFKYDVTVKSEGSTLKLESLAKISQGGRDDNYERGGFLLIPCDFFGRDAQASLNMCIRRDSTSNALYASRNY